MNKYSNDDYRDEVNIAYNSIFKADLFESNDVKEEKIALFNDYKVIVEIITDEFGELLNADFLRLNNPLTFHAYCIIRERGFKKGEIEKVIKAMLVYDKLKKYTDCIKLICSWIKLDRERQAK